MLANASAALITALKNSLADVNAGWVVADVSEASGVRIGAVTKSTDTFVTLEGSKTAVIDVGTTSATTVVTTIELHGRALVQSVGGAAGLQLTYTSVWVDGAFSKGMIEHAGGAYMSTDSALDTTIRGLAATHLSGKDTALKDALVAGPQTSNGGEYIDATTLAGIKASLAAPADGWYVTAVNVSKFARETMLSVTMQSTALFMPPTSKLPAQLSYTARTVGATIVEANIAVRGNTWRTTDAALHTAIAALAATFRSDTSDDLAVTFA